MSHSGMPSGGQLSSIKWNGMDKCKYTQAGIEGLACGGKVYFGLQ